jgi:uncharacterized protein (TIGR03000 family)
MMAGPAWAQHHGGGGHGGGFHGGGGHTSGFHHGGFHGGGFHHGGFHDHGFHDHGFHHRGFFFPGYYPGYYSGDYPSYSYYSDYDYGNYSPYSYYPNYDYGNYSSYGLGYGSPSDLGSSHSNGTVGSAPADSTAHLTLKVPANAEVWFEGAKTTSTGSVREYQSPPLSAGRYTYHIRARWTENGRDITQTKNVTVSSGAHLTVEFPIASGIN